MKPIADIVVILEVNKLSLMLCVEYISKTIGFTSSLLYFFTSKTLPYFQKTFFNSLTPK